MPAARIDQVFAELRANGGRALMPFLTAGDPDLDTTARLLPALERAGASVCELGIPFSDPIADGPVIQASMTHALDQGVRLGRVFDMVADARGSLDMGLVAMVSYSIVYRRGVSAFCRDAAAAGFDGLIFPDLAVEESAEATAAAKDAGLALAMLIAPTTGTDRAAEIARASSGFVYVLARAGITGERDSLPPELPQRIEALRGVTDLPLCVGFGIGKAEQVRQVVEVADAAIVGSAVMRRVAERRDDGADAVVDAVERLVGDLATGLPAKAGTGTAA